MKKRERKYEAVVGSHLSDNDARKIGSVFEELDAKGIGVSRESIVAHAMKKSSPIHGLRVWGGWNKAKAAEAHWLDIASYLIRSVKVTVVVHGSKATQPVRARVFVRKHEDDEELTCMPTDEAMEDPDLRRQIVQRALREAAAWSERHKGLQELAGIFAAIDAAQLKLGIAS